VPLTLKEMRLRAARDRGLTTRQQAQRRRRQIERRKMQRVTWAIARELARKLALQGVWL
jgi:hypothetical protein